uniref:Uncharacterized protein n=1 Tax=Rhizophora mucronata TaxID=61149 RepID=A0A2P2NYC8_RHIMU
MTHFFSELSSVPISCIKAHLLVLVSQILHKIVAIASVLDILQVVDLILDRAFAKFSYK